MFADILAILGLKQPSKLGRKVAHYFVYPHQDNGWPESGFAMLWHDARDMNGLRSDQFEAEPVWDYENSTPDATIAALTERLVPGRATLLDCDPLQFSDDELRKRDDLRLWVPEFVPPNPVSGQKFYIKLGLTTDANSKKLYESTRRRAKDLEAAYKREEILPEKRLFGTLVAQAPVLTRDDYMVFVRSPADGKTWVPGCEIELDPFRGNFPPDAIRRAVGSDLGITSRNLGIFERTSTRFVLFGREWGPSLNVVLMFTVRLPISAKKLAKIWLAKHELTAPCPYLLVPSGIRGKHREEHKLARDILYDLASARRRNLDAETLTNAGAIFVGRSCDIERLHPSTGAVRILAAMANRVPKLTHLFRDVERWSISRTSNASDPPTDCTTSNITPSPKPNAPAVAINTNPCAPVSNVVKVCISGHKNLPIVHIMTATNAAGILLTERWPRLACLVANLALQSAFDERVRQTGDLKRPGVVLGRSHVVQLMASMPVTYYNEDFPPKLPPLNRRSDGHIPRDKRYNTAIETARRQLEEAGVTFASLANVKDSLGLAYQGPPPELDKTWNDVLVGWLDEYRRAAPISAAKSTALQQKMVDLGAKQPNPQSRLSQAEGLKSAFY